MPPDQDWTFVAVAPRDGNLKQQALSLLAAAGYEGVPETDVKIDVICTRGKGEDSIRAWVRSGSTASTGL